MREHMGLFRGKRSNGEWAEGSLHIEYGEMTKDGNRAIDYRILGMCGECYYVDPDTLGECTSLKDKNGKLIFEGDLLRYYVDSTEVKKGGIAIVNFGRFKDTDAMSDFDHLGWHITIPMLEEEATTIFALEEEGIAFDVIGTIYDDKEFNEICGATNLPCIKCSAGPCSNRKLTDNPELLKGGEG